MCSEIDIQGNYTQTLSAGVLEWLLTDHSRSHQPPCGGGQVSYGTNIIWATDDYRHLGPQYSFHSPITADLITGANGQLIMPRVAKSRLVQQERVRRRAEVFTPAWVCNAQNNLVDDAWFGRKGVFNTESPDHTWTATTAAVAFPEGRSWRDYVAAPRMEISCGEAPYLTSRYDAATGEAIPIGQRIGLLDRKLRVASENCATTTLWLEAAYQALKSIYAYEWQGDSLLIARMNLLSSFVEAYRCRFGRKPKWQSVKKAAYIISWNIVQMDGLKFVVPDSCHSELERPQLDIFGNATPQTIPCPGCMRGEYLLHNGIRTMVRDWSRSRKKQVISFRSLINKS